MINDQKYISHKAIAADITRVYKNKPVNLDDILEWCSQVETRYAIDVDKMVLYLKVPLEVDLETSPPQALMPCNVFRLLDVFNDGEEYTNYYNNGSYLILPANYNEEYVYLNFVGTAISDEGDPLIIKGHENACETFCKIRLFEEDVAYGRFNQQMWAMWKEEFSGQVAASKCDMRHFDRQHFNKLNIIHGNMIPKIGGVRLYHKNFTADGTV